MNISPEIDLSRSLAQVFGSNKADFADQITQDCARQSETANAILQRYFSAKERERRELMILADEVGLGKTYVALAVAVTILDAIRRGDPPAGLPSNKPVVLVLTPTNDALFNKWMREAETFKKDCARRDGGLDWLEIVSPIEGSSKSGNVIDLSKQLRQATRAKPLLLIAKHGVFGAALHDRDLWRKRSLAAVFGYFRTPLHVRRRWCRKGKVFDNLGIPDHNDLLDLRSSGHLWEDDISPDLEKAFNRVLSRQLTLSGRIRTLLDAEDEGRMAELLDDIARHALATDWPEIPLVLIDEVHGFKNQHVQSRQHFERLATGKVSRLLGLSATPFQLRHDELLSLLGLRQVLSLGKERFQILDDAVAKLSEAMKVARDSGESFRQRWKSLRSSDQALIHQTWDAVASMDESNRQELAAQIRPPRVSHAITSALCLQQGNAVLRRHLHPFVIRHHHARGYREHFVGKKCEARDQKGQPTFSWQPGMEVRGNDELAQYVMMRAVALAKEERGLPSLGAELTGSYRHLVETSAIWKKLSQASNPLLRKYRSILDAMIGRRTDKRDPDAEHRKVQATVRRAMEFFKRGQKSLVFCVYTKTAEAVRDQLQSAIDSYLAELRQGVFGELSAFENFRRRFFNRREVMFSLIQDHPLLGTFEGTKAIVPSEIALTAQHLEEISQLLVDRGELADSDKPDRRLIIAATEQVAVKAWQTSASGKKWLQNVLKYCPELESLILDVRWLDGREPLSRSLRAGRRRKSSDPEALERAHDPLEAEESDGEAGLEKAAEVKGDHVNAWIQRFRGDAIGAIIAPYFQPGLIEVNQGRSPLLADHHGELLASFDLDTRAVAGQVFRRILMAEEFLLRYLADVEKEQTAKWTDYLADRYTKPLNGHLETLRDRVHAYLETLFRARKNNALLQGYHAGAENRNVIQLVKGDTQNRDRYFLGFNTPYRPEILVSTSVGQEGIDLHRECRHVIHHDLCWNPATIEQRTGRVDRIGSKVERERRNMEEDGPTLQIGVPYLAATYDERMFEELYRRAQLFEVTLGGEVQIDGQINPGGADEKNWRDELGIGTLEEELGVESQNTSVVDLPLDMIEKLRVDLAVWKL